VHDLLPRCYPATLAPARHPAGEEAKPPQARNSTTDTLKRYTHCLRADLGLDELLLDSAVERLQFGEAAALQGGRGDDPGHHILLWFAGPAHQGLSRCPDTHNRERKARHGRETENQREGEEQDGAPPQRGCGCIEQEAAVADRKRRRPARSKDFYAAQQHSVLLIYITKRCNVEV
jgi:hypothetical protein